MQNIANCRSLSEPAGCKFLHLDSYQTAFHTCATCFSSIGSNGVDVLVGLPNGCCR
jgi:hypothetical protein